jgi:hypothetical protein
MYEIREYIKQIAYNHGLVVSVINAGKLLTFCMASPDGLGIEQGSICL